MSTWVSSVLTALVSAIVGGVISPYLLNTRLRRQGRADVLEVITRAELSMADVGSAEVRLPVVISEVERAALIGGIPQVYVDYYVATFSYAFTYYRIAHLHETAKEPPSPGVIAEIQRLTKFAPIEFQELVQSLHNQTHQAIKAYLRGPLRNRALAKWRIRRYEELLLACSGPLHLPISGRALEKHNIRTKRETSTEQEKNSIGG